jgi:SHS family lactate transporter-like MFS transporter
MTMWRAVNRILWHRSQPHNAYLVSTLAWLFSALGFFLLIVKASDIQGDFTSPGAQGYGAWQRTLSGLNLSWVTPVLFVAITVTLLARFVGAVICAPLAEYGGRRRWLLGVMAFCGAVELSSGLAPYVVHNFAVFVALRILFGMGMGGVWAVGAPLAMEWVPQRLPDRPERPERHGLVSGFFQQGYALGNLLAALFALVAGALALLFHVSLPEQGWRVMFICAGLLELIVLWVCIRWLPFEESAVWKQRHAAYHGAYPAGEERSPSKPHDAKSSRAASRQRLFIVLYGLALMSVFACMAHGSQDVYPTFLSKQVGLLDAPMDIVIAIYALGAAIGGYFFAYYSDNPRFGRHRCIIVPAFLGLLLIPLWSGLFPWGIGGAQTHVLSSTPAALLLIGVFLMQFMVQGAYGVIPAHLNELSQTFRQGAWRGIFPGVVYHAGLLPAALIPLVIAFCSRLGSARGASPNYAVGQTIVLVAVFALMIVITAVLAPDRETTTSAASAQPTPRAEAVSSTA